MKTGKLVAMVMAVGGLAIGCGDDATPGGSAGGSGSSTGSASTSGADSSDGGTTEDTAVPTGSAEGGSSESSSGEPPPVEVTVEGEVINLDPLMQGPIPGAEIALFDDPSVNTVADGEGLFSIGTFPTNTTQLFLLAPSMDFWGAIIPVQIGEDPLQEDEQLTQISNQTVDDQFALLMDQMPADQLPDTGIIIVRLRNNSAVAEGATVVEMDPPPPMDTFYAPDAAGAPVLGQNEILFTFLPVVVYYNVPETSAGEISFTATHPTRECEVVYPDFPTLAGHMTLVELNCVTP